jgi:hypothetical protein
MLVYMIRSAVIFSDRDQDQKEEKNFHSPHKDKVNMSREEYRQLIKDAYQEGREDALKERVKKQSEKQEKAAEEKKGKEEAIRLHAKQKEENRQRYKTITQRHEIEILRAKSVFPFTLFPDTLVIDTTKVTIARKQLFATEYVATIPLKDLSDVNIQTVLFLGTLMIRYMPQSNTPGMNEPVNCRIPNLKREDAIRAKNILKGALVAKAEEIDIAKLPPDEVVKVLEKFGANEGVV